MALVIITAVYAFLTHQIGERTSAMVSEARRTRQDAHRPFLDIRGTPEAIEWARLEVEKLGGPDAPQEYVTCEVKNVGDSPAFAVQLFVNFDGSSAGNGHVLDAPTLMPGYEIVDSSGPRPADAERILITGPPSASPLRLRIEPFEGDASGRRGVRVEYGDVFGRRFISRKPFVLGSSGLLGALEIIDMEPAPAAAAGTGERA